MKQDHNQHAQFITKHKIHGELLKEFVSRKNWIPALQSCKECIVKRKEELEMLEELGVKLGKEIE